MIEIKRSEFIVEDVHPFYAWIAGPQEDLHIGFFEDIFVAAELELGTGPR